MKYLKSFESMFKAHSKEFEELWEYYICSNCGFEYSIFKPKYLCCIKCGSKDITLVDKFFKV